MGDDRERLLDMLEAIQKIEQYAHDETFSSQNENLVEVWMYRLSEKLLREFQTNFERNIPKLHGAE